jgi:hypothetical protein
LPGQSPERLNTRPMAEVIIQRRAGREIELRLYLT